MNPRKQQPRYELTHYDGKDFDVRPITLPEIRELDITKVDHFHALCLGKISFQPRKGKRIEYRDKWPKIGDVGFGILQAIQLNPGTYLRPKDLAELLARKSLTNPGVLPARVMKLREAHHEQGCPYFIQSRTACGYALMWPAERTWMTIDRVRVCTPVG